MEVWEKEFEWLRVRHFIKEAMKKDVLPDFQAILFLIGVQELGYIRKEKYTKEEKRDLMHIAICALLESEGYFHFEGRDQDGWPHWKVVKPFDIIGVEKQEEILKNKILDYFHAYLNNQQANYSDN